MNPKTYVSEYPERVDLLLDKEMMSKMRQSNYLLAKEIDNIVIPNTAAAT